MIRAQLYRDGKRFDGYSIGFPEKGKSYKFQFFPSGAIETTRVTRVIYYDDHISFYTNNSCYTLVISKLFYNKADAIFSVVC